MQPKDFLKQMILIHRSVFDNAFKNAALLQQQMEQAMDFYIERAAGLSDEGKKAFRDWAAMHRKAFEDYRKLVDENFAKLDYFFQDRPAGNRSGQRPETGPPGASGE